MELIVMVFALIGSSAIVLSRTNGHRRISLAATAFSAVFLLHGVSAIPYYLGLFPRDIDAQHIPVSPHFSWVVSISLVMFAAGVAAFSGRTAFTVKRQHAWLNSDVTYAKPPSLIPVVGLTVLVASVGLAYALKEGRLGLSLLVSGASPEHLKAFRQSFADAGALGYWAALVNNGVGPFTLLYTRHLYRTYRRGYQLAAFWLVLAILVLSSSTSLHKAPLVMLGLYLLVDAALSRARPVSPSRLVPVAAVLLIVVGLVGYVLTYGQDPLEAARMTAYRVFVAPQSSLSRYLFVYPDLMPFDGGTGIRLVARLVGVTDYQAPAVLVGELTANSPWRVSYNAYWAADMWAAFGYPGVVIGSFGVGALLVTLERWLLRQSPRPAFKALLAYTVVSSLQLASASVFTVSLSGGLLTIPLLALFVVALERARGARSFHRRGALAAVQARR